jgi:aspartyl aminopeptidase
MLLCFDSEETGSLTYSGACSAFTQAVLDRYLEHHPHATTWSYCQEASFLISADMAHGLHPNYPDKHEQNHRPLLNQGLVIKENANDRYATTAHTEAFIKNLSKVPLQNYVVRQDAGCGSTIGPTLAALLNIPTLDIGAPMWAMHSTCETMGAQDLHHAHTLFKDFLSS